MDASGTFNVRKIAIIGAGPSGLATAKYLLAERSFSQIDIFEQRSTVGGIWNFSLQTTRVPLPQTSPCLPVEDPQRCNDGELIFPSPMYEGLEANIPLELMEFTDLPFTGEPKLFPTHEEVKQYVEEYANGVRQLIHFSTQVLDVRPLDSPNYIKGNIHRAWRVKTRKSGTQLEETRDYDAVVVASGHYNVACVPGIRGLEAWNESYPGVITHSMSYRRPGPFKGKKVVIVGNSASGIDIGAQIATVCAHPLLSSLRSQSFFLPPGAGNEVWKEDLPEIAAFLPPSEGSRAIRFANDHIETGIDAVVFCTGYLHSHPYLSSLDPSPQTPDGMRTQHVYQHLFFIPNPTLAFVNLTHKAIPFTTAESQGAAIARVWNNRIFLPSRGEMDRWEAEEVAVKGSGRPFHAMNYPLDASYINDMHAWCLLAEPRVRDEKLPPFWGGRQKWIRERFQAIKKSYVDRGAARHQVKSLEELGFDYEKWKEEEEKGLESSLQEAGEKAASR
ncbi:MAG: hypothetical protein M1839_006654 [Geoglossum umbratile]|nr:MAG: hypothetical protein M1839_006654 [Geoglossum umbratile]